LSWRTQAHIEVITSNRALVVFNLFYTPSVRKGDERSLTLYSGIIGISANTPEEITKDGQRESEKRSPHRRFAIEQYIIDASHYCLTLLYFSLYMVLFGCLFGLGVYGV
jgi:hypothetical protein